MISARMSQPMPVTRKSHQRSAASARTSRSSNANLINAISPPLVPSVACVLSLVILERAADGAGRPCLRDERGGCYPGVDDLDPYRTDTQKEWNDWARHGYRKLYQPRSMLWFGGIFFTLFG